MTLSKKPVKRGRPPGSKNKPKTSAVKVKRDIEDNYLIHYESLLARLKEERSQVEDLKHKEIGYRAVISYLQARLDGNAEL